MTPPSFLLQGEFRVSCRNGCVRMSVWWDEARVSRGSELYTAAHSAVDTHTPHEWSSLTSVAGGGFEVL
jgi:hypothetical protein